MKCPKCSSQRCSKNGRKNGKQRFLCTDCGRQFVSHYSPRGYSNEFKQICLKEYLEGKSSREIEEERRVHHTTVLLWAKQAGIARRKTLGADKSADSGLAQSANDTETKLPEKISRGGVAAESYPDSSRAQNNLSVSTRSLKQRQKAEAILRSALKVFTVHGYTAASMNRIAERACVSKPTLYRYFGSKEALFTVLIERVLVRVQKNIFELTISHSEQLSPAEILHQLAIAVLTKLTKEKSVFPLMRLIIGESGRFPEAAKTFVAKVEKPIFRRLAAYLKFHPAIHPKEPMAMARIFIGALSHYLIVQNLLSGKDIVPLKSELLVEELVSRMVA